MAAVLRMTKVESGRDSHRVANARGTLPNVLNRSCVAITHAGKPDQQAPPSRISECVSDTTFAAPPDPCALGDSRGYVPRHAPLRVWHRRLARLGPTEIGSYAYPTNSRRVLPIRRYAMQIRPVARTKNAQVGSAGPTGGRGGLNGGFLSVSKGVPSFEDPYPTSRQQASVPAIPPLRGAFRMSGDLRHVLRHVLEGVS